LIFPFNGNGLEALDCLGGAWTFAGFVDDTPEKQGRSKHGTRVLARGVRAHARGERARGAGSPPRTPTGAS
jgi:hypothetical protein